MSTLEYVLEKFNINIYSDTEASPIEVPNFGRDQLADLFADLGFNFGVEIGVESGAYSKRLLEVNPDLFLYSVDPWEAHRGYRDHTRQSKLDRFYEETVAALKPFGIRSKIFRKFSMDALKLFDDDSLDFVYIDANHSFVTVAQDIYHWSKKVKRGGIVSGHDYTRYAHQEANIHVFQVVNGYTDAYGIRPWFVFGNEGEVKNWMWVKQ